jgi:hypothetical protein
MYSNFKFQSAKAELAFAFTHKPTDSMGQVEIAFLRSILSAAAKYGRVTPDDVYRAVESSGVFDLDLDEGEKDKIVADLWNIGDNYIGALSRQQAAELRRLRKLCLLAAATGDADAWAQIAELI